VTDLRISILSQDEERKGWEERGLILITAAVAIPSSQTWDLSYSKLFTHFGVSVWIFFKDLKYAMMTYHEHRPPLPLQLHDDGTHTLDHLLFQILKCLKRRRVQRFECLLG
jgi:hypothetical protein